MNETLFDEQIDTSLVNKVESFYSKPVQKQRKTQKQRVFDFLCSHGRATQRMISEGTGIPRHLIPDRLKTLREDGLVKESGSIHDLKSNKNVTAYEIT